MSESFPKPANDNREIVSVVQQELVHAIRRYEEVEAACEAAKSATETENVTRLQTGRSWSNPTVADWEREVQLAHEHIVDLLQSVEAVSARAHEACLALVEAAGISLHLET